MPAKVSLATRVARWLIESEVPTDREYFPGMIPIELRALSQTPKLIWPDKKTQPIAKPLSPRPTPGDKLPSDVDYLVITWTREEHEALRKVFTPKVKREDWYPYTRRYHSYLRRIRSGRDPPPSRRSQRLGSYSQVNVGDKRVLCFKSELHLAQDGIKLPLLNLIVQLIEEARPRHVLSIGTAGGVKEDDLLGYAVVSNAARFKLMEEFKRKSYNGRLFKSDWKIRTSEFDVAEGLMMTMTEPPFAPYSTRIPFNGSPIQLPPNAPRIRFRPEDPIITTDGFLYGTSTNGLDQLGSAVEMDDAVIAMGCESSDSKPPYCFVRNVSDPVINGALEKPVADMWAVFFYKRFGLQTSFNGALATWAIIAGN